MHKTTLHPSPIALLLAAVAARFRAAMEKCIPVGYQDETGFHLGENRNARDSENWPAFW